MQDIREIEKVPLEERFREKNVYDLLVRGSEIHPEAKALSFLMSGDLYEHPIQVSHREFIGKIRQAANFFHDLGVGPTDVVTYLLPNLIATHCVLWGAEIAGISNPINPLLEPATICDICRAAGTKVLVALGEIPGSNIWDKVKTIRKEIPTLKSIVRVMGPSDEKDGIYGFEEKLESYPSDRLGGAFATRHPVPDRGPRRRPDRGAHRTGGVAHLQRSPAHERLPEQACGDPKRLAGARRRRLDAHG
jgi:fatty-acyl-CoA synthase